MENADETLPLSTASHVGVVAGAGERVTRTEDLLRRLKVDGLIRLHAADFRLLAGAGPMFTHFNLESTSNTAGCRYAILPIVKPGRRLPNGREVLPVVDPTYFRMGTCVETIQRVALTAVTAEHFAESLPTIKTSESLRSALLKRYTGMFPNLTEDDIVARGCALTRLRLD